jgi:hypothetical protein
MGTFETGEYDLADYDVSSERGFLPEQDSP